MERFKRIIEGLRDSYLPFIVVLVLLAVSILVQYRFFLPRYRTDWNKELTHERDSIIRELKNEGIFFNNRD